MTTATPAATVLATDRSPRYAPAVAHILLVHGPNLNLLGRRQPEVYGTGTLADLEEKVTGWADELEMTVETFQSNHEGALVDRIQAARTKVDGLVLNLGALTHYSYALADAITAVELPAVEVHISNIATREAWRRHSVTAESCRYAVFGRGIEGYRDALRVLRWRTDAPVETLTYGEHPDQLIDLRRPAERSVMPPVVLIHGGFWRSQWTRDTIDGLAVDLTGRGHLTANIEYRRLDTGGGWPETGDDVLEALRTVSALPEVRGAPLALVGHSAGGHLALWAAARSEVPIHSVLALAPVADLAEAHRLGLGDGVVDRFMGGSPGEVPDRYADADPAVNPPAVPVTILHGTDDEALPVDLATRYAQAHPSADVTLVVADGVGHFDVIDPGHRSWTEVGVLAHNQNAG